MKLLSHTGTRGGGGEYAYETLNFVDGQRSVADICAFVSAIYGPISLEHVTEYLAALESIGIVHKVDGTAPRAGGD